jgi:hypothetical protein
MSLGICPACGALRQLIEGCVLASHQYVIEVSAKAIHAAGSRRVRRRCPGSGQPPRRRERP